MVALIIRRRLITILSEPDAGGGAAARAARIAQRNLRSARCRKKWSADCRIIQVTAAACFYYHPYC